MKSDEIEKVAEQNKNMTEQQIADFAEKLHEKYTAIDLPTLRKLVRNEVTRTKGTMLYDLDWDVQLVAALDILSGTKAEFEELVKNTKTLKELQEEAALKDESLSAEKK